MDHDDGNMTKQTPADDVSDQLRPSHTPRVPVPNTSMLPGSEKPAPAVVGLLKDAVQGAHERIDRLADSAAPAVQQWGERMSAATDVLQAKADQWRGTRHEWAQSARGTVQGKPLTALASAISLGLVAGFVLGVVIARAPRRPA